MNTPKPLKYILAVITIIFAWQILSGMLPDHIRFNDGREIELGHVHMQKTQYHVIVESLGFNKTYVEGDVNHLKKIIADDVNSIACFREPCIVRDLKVVMWVEVFYFSDRFPLIPVRVQTEPVKFYTDKNGYITQADLIDEFEVELTKLWITVFWDMDKM